MNHITVGVYLNGDYNVNVVRPNDLKSHIDYNKVMRFGRALFVDNKCVHNGYLDDNKVKEWEGKISKMNFDKSTPSKEYI